jgi:hypothetical protein
VQSSAKSGMLMFATNSKLVLYICSFKDSERVGGEDNKMGRGEGEERGGGRERSGRGMEERRGGEKGEERGGILRGYTPIVD